jgi:RimJ/RimL family protein N-acetyltransferase
MMQRPSEPQVEALKPADAERVLELYRAVAADPRSGLSRDADEMTQAYVDYCLGRAAASGIALGATVDGQLVGEIHAWCIGPRQFAGVLTDLTIAVHPSMQGRGIGTRLFRALFAAADSLEPRIERIELFCRSGNQAALELYRRLGFEIEGAFRRRVRLGDGSIEDDIPMARFRPS